MEFVEQPGGKLKRRPHSHIRGEKRAKEDRPGKHDRYLEQARKNATVDFGHQVDIDRALDDYAGLTLEERADMREANNIIQQLVDESAPSREAEGGSDDWTLDMLNANSDLSNTHPVPTLTDKEAISEEASYRKGIEYTNHMSNRPSRSGKRIRHFRG
jgi:hypothetical protein